MKAEAAVGRVEHRASTELDASAIWISACWKTALVFFIVSVLTGVLYRSGIAYGFTAGLDLVNIRHAHSHTMYFGWATPALFLMIGLRSGLPRLRPLLILLFAAAALAYPLFLAFGYRPVDVGSARMPLAVVAATLNTIIWYAFVALYFRHRDPGRASESMMLWDTSLAFLLLATTGAFGLALLKPLGVEDPVWPVALTHVFLDLFSEGWFVLAVLGLTYDALDRGESRNTRPSRSFRVALLMVTLGLPFTFPMGMPESLVGPVLEGVSRVGTFLVGAGLLMLSGRLFGRARERRLWLLPLGLLALKAAGQLGTALGVGFWIADYHGLRILYLHVMLVGFVSTGLVAAARSMGLQRGTWSVRIYFGAVAVLLLSLVPLTEPFFGGNWAFRLATWVALLPALAAIFLMANGRVAPVETV